MLSPSNADVHALGAVAALLWEARVIYKTVFCFMTDDEWRDPLSALVKARSIWSAHLRERVESLAGPSAPSPFPQAFDDRRLNICRCLIEGDRQGAIDHIEICEDRLRAAVRQHLRDPGLTGAAIGALTLALQALEGPPPSSLMDLHRASGRGA